MSFDLNFHLHRLLRDEPFFASFCRSVIKTETKSIPTAAMAFNKDSYSFEMLYNGDFMESLCDEHRVGVIKHELYHMIYGHLTKRLKFDMAKDHQRAKLWNIAADLAINSYIFDELPDMACVPGRTGFEEYPLYLATEAYFKMLCVVRLNSLCN